MLHFITCITKQYTKCAFSKLICPLHWASWCCTHFPYRVPTSGCDCPKPKDWLIGHSWQSREELSNEILLPLSQVIANICICVQQKLYWTMITIVLNIQVQDILFSSHKFNPLLEYLTSRTFIIRYCYQNLNYLILITSFRSVIWAWEA